MENLQKSINGETVVREIFVILIIEKKYFPSKLGINQTEKTFSSRCQELLSKLQERIQKVFSRVAANSVGSSKFKMSWKVGTIETIKTGPN